MTLLTAWLLILFFIGSSRAQDATGSASADYAARVSTTEENAVAADDTDYGKMLRDFVAKGFASMPASFTRKLLAADVQPECSIALLRTMRAFKNLDPWALRLLDATGKYPTGVFQVSRVDFGAFDECLETEVRDSSGQLQSLGQYCNLLIAVKNRTITERILDHLSGVIHHRFLDYKDLVLNARTPLIRIGICFLNDCSEEDIQALIDSVIPPVVKAEVSNCVTAEPEPWNRTQAAVVIFFTVLAIIVFGATLVDHFLKPEHKAKCGMPLKLVTAFSAVTNSEILFQCNDKRNPDHLSLQFMHGVRFFSVAHIVLGHCYEAVSDSWARLLNMFIENDHWTNLIIATGFNSVDTFFFLSGFFLCLVITKQKANGPIVFLIAVIRRLIRICIPLFFVIMCFYGVPRFVSGPNVKAFFLKFYDEIATDWWGLLLQIRNFSEFRDETLLVHLWYLSSDFQLFVVSLLVLLLLKSRKALSLGAFAVLSLLGCAIAMWTAADPEVVPFMMFPGFTKRRVLKTLNLYYIKPFYHAVCFFSGCVTLMLLEDFRDRKISKGVRFAGWCVSTSCALCVMFMKVPWYKHVDPTPGAAKLLVAFFDRVLWSISLAWITLACSTGQGGLVGRLLSLNVFVPLSKLSFGIYMIHYPFIQLMLHASRERQFWSHFTQVTLFFGVLAWSVLLAYLSFVMCEAPTAALDKLVFQRLTRRGRATALDGAARPSGQEAGKPERIETDLTHYPVERL
ncbi:nose resistant to fluoxetine protein 6-like [Amblyomma americanum]